MIDNFDLDNEKSQDEYNACRNRQENIFQESFTHYLNQYDELPRKYIHDMITDDKNLQFDHKYDIRHNPTLEKFYMVDSQLHIDGSDIVKNKRYKATEGYMDCFLKNIPKISPRMQKIV